MRVVIRTDASLEIGTGHVMRCLTLAASLRERGAETLFVCREHSGNLIEPIRQKGFEVLTLSIARTHGQPENSGNLAMPQHASWLGADWQTDANATRAALRGQAIDWIVVDHYALNADWEKSMRSACRRIMVIDDLADRPHDCDLLLDQNLGRMAEDYDGLVPETCSRLIGPQFALLRPEFATMRDYSLARRATPALKRLLISMGGVDGDNATGEVLQALVKCSLPEDCRIVIVMGQHAPWLASVRQLAEKLPWRTELLVNVADMASLMAESDLAIGGAGATAWERCCLGLPSIVVVLADNQRSGAVALQQSHAASVLMERELIISELPALISRIAESGNMQSMHASCLHVGDGHGVSRVIDKLTACDE